MNQSVVKYKLLMNGEKSNSQLSFTIIKFLQNFEYVLSIRLDFY